MEEEKKDDNNDNKVNKDDKDNANEVDKEDEVDKDDKVFKDNQADKDVEENKEEEEFFFSKNLKMTQYTSMPNLVRLAQWEQVSEYYYYILQPVILKARTNQFAYAKIQ